MEDENKNVRENKDESIQEIDQNDIEEENEEESIKDSLKKNWKAFLGHFNLFYSYFCFNNSSLNYSISSLKKWRFAGFLV